MEFRIDTSTGRPVGVAAMPTRLDAVSGKLLKASFQRWTAITGMLVFDCSSLRFIDSSGLGALVNCLRKSIDIGGDLRLSGLVSQVGMVFELTRANQIFAIYTDLPQALDSFAGQIMEEPS